MSAVEASALWCPTLHRVVTVLEGTDGRCFDDVSRQKILRTHRTLTEKVTTNLQTTVCYSGVWSKRRQTKTATVKTATNQNGDKLYGQNGDTVSAKTATNQNGDKVYGQNGDNYRLICDVVMFLVCLSVYLR